MDKNQLFRTYIGMGYYNCKVPGVILRNVLENPEWYTPYTPYQAEISQGRLESLLNFQTMICDLTGMQFANASLLDESTACAEAMTFCMRNSSNAKTNRFFLSDNCFPQNIAVVQNRAEPLGIEIIVDNPFTFDFDANPVAGVLFQYPAIDGEIQNYSKIVNKLKNKNIMTVFSSDLLALTMLIPPGELGADVAVGTTQRFGVPVGYGGPHAGYFAVNDQKYSRKIPGRVVGVSVDARGKKAYRLSLQTREQHIKREKATSNICTAQALPANLSAFYAVYHGPSGLKKIAERVHLLTVTLAEGLKKLGHTVQHTYFFDTISVDHYDLDSQGVLKRALHHKMNFRYLNEDHVCISLDETTELKDVQDIWRVFESTTQDSGSRLWIDDPTNLMNGIRNVIESNSDICRTSSYLTNAVFNRYHKEHNMLRYLYRLCTRDLSLCTSMIPLGSCTMKLNATSEMAPITWPKAANVHPFVPLNQAEGYQEMLTDLKRMLCAVTGFDDMSLQPNSGASGEFTGLRVIKKYLQSIGQGHRNVVLIPASSHGTNPASGSMAGLKIVVIPCLPNGYINMDALKAKAKLHEKDLAALMITYPSTYGIYEEAICEVCDIIHENGGQVYLDGANMNALVGLVSLKEIGADVCHLNLHKTFCIPHGGGGPGMGPIGVSSHLAPFLPSHPVIPSNNNKEAMGPVAAAPWSSGCILLISWMYLRMMGSDGLRKATQTAILNANYMKERLKDYYPVRYTSSNGMVAHEFIMDLRPFKQSANIEVADVAKRLMDYNFHSPTMSWPVPGTLMIEPTESESLDELDRLCNALISIRQEIMQIEDGTQPKEDNVLKNAPHVPDLVCATEWTKPYPRELAAYPLPYLYEHKFWPAVSRIDNEFGDTHLICSCPPLDTYL
eukprot:CAMPEP_0117001254 /NCGR_PEP_ID=MMETSP0472-20121206/3312_1 /TAXON_ID=693140 ORGANISM="Tiarina fusus, Strain LIS" /NCGR_SAMPLE_ID=MMETSP0472 /ASSEMBLY_ACC=CAM_ASM_000603 /LENGTH=896 /DNA_ID=CAMNT_0004701195 /DNA_START=379 /DNA_END=3069 /DNA_ORIENTATION=-